MEPPLVQISLESIWKRSKWIMELSKFHWNQLVRVRNGTSTGPNFLGIQFGTVQNGSWNCPNFIGINSLGFVMEPPLVQISLESIWNRSKWNMELSKFHWNQLVRVRNGTSTGPNFPWNQFGTVQNGTWNCPNFIGINSLGFVMEHPLVHISLESIWNRSKWIMELSKFHWNQLRGLHNAMYNAANIDCIKSNKFPTHFTMFSKSATTISSGTRTFSPNVREIFEKSSFEFPSFFFFTDAILNT